VFGTNFTTYVIFHKVIYRHPSGVLGSLMIADTLFPRECK